MTRLMYTRGYGVAVHKNNERSRSADIARGEVVEKERNPNFGVSPAVRRG